MFRALRAHHQEVKIVYTASGIFTSKFNCSGFILVINQLDAQNLVL